MKKFIARNFYKICMFLIFIYICLCFIPNIIIKAISFVVLVMLFILIKRIHTIVFDDFNKKFLWEKFFIEDRNKEYLSDEEEQNLYDKLYYEYFKK